MRFALRNGESLDLSELPSATFGWLYWFCNGKPLFFNATNKIRSYIQQKTQETIFQAVAMIMENLWFNFNLCISFFLRIADFRMLSLHVLTKRPRHVTLLQPCCWDLRSKCVDSCPDGFFSEKGELDFCKSIDFSSRVLSGITNQWQAGPLSHRVAPWRSMYVLFQILQQMRFWYLLQRVQGLVCRSRQISPNDET